MVKLTEEKMLQKSLKTLTYPDLNIINPLK